jgi:hypothetical protein
MKIKDSETSTVTFDMTEDGDAVIGIFTDNGWSSCRFCTVIGGDMRPQSKIIRKAIRQLIKDLEEADNE